MGKISVIAQNTMDLYYQDYKSDEDFFELYHFQYLNSIAYAALLQEEYEKAYAQSLQIEGFPNAELNDAWYIQKEIDIVKAREVAPFETELKVKPFSFRYDKSGVGVKEIIPMNGRCGDFIRISILEKYKFKLIPASSAVYWFVLGNNLYYNNISCGVTKAILVYIPSLFGCDDDDFEVSEVVEYEMIKRTLQIMAEARNGTVIDMSNDSNPNKTIQTEIDNKFSKMRQG